MKKILVTLFLLIATQAFADPIPCPTADEIRAMPIPQVFHTGNNLYAVGETFPTYYSASHPWALAIAHIYARSDEEARYKARQYIDQIQSAATFSAGMYPYDNKFYLVCVYPTEDPAIQVVASSLP